MKESFYFIVQRSSGVILFQCVGVILFQCVGAILFQCVGVILFQCVGVILFQCVGVILFQCVGVILSQCAGVTLFQRVRSSMSYYCVISVTQLLTAKTPAFVWTHQNTAGTVRNGWRCSCDCCSLTQVRPPEFPVREKRSAEEKKKY